MKPGWVRDDSERAGKQVLAVLSMVILMVSGAMVGLGVVHLNAGQSCSGSLGYVVKECFDEIPFYIGFMLALPGCCFAYWATGGLAGVGGPLLIGLGIGYWTTGVALCVPVGIVLILAGGAILLWPRRPVQP